MAAHRLADPDQAKRLLPGLTRGEVKASVALWNPADAGDTRPVFTAERSDGGWTLRGAQLFVPNAELTDVVLVTAVATVFTEPRRVLAFLVRPGARRLVSRAGADDVGRQAGAASARRLLRRRRGHVHRTGRHGDR